MATAKHPSLHLRSSFVRDQRGAAMVEGVIVLPFFIAALALIIHFHRAYTAKLDASVQARSCAWQFSVQGCKGKVPKGCNMHDLRERGKELASFMDDPVLASQADDAFARDRRSGALDEGLKGVNAIGLTLLGLRDGYESRPSREVGRPSILGGGKRTVTGSYAVMCNEVKMTVGDVLKQMYDAYAGPTGLPL